MEAMARINSARRSVQQHREVLLSALLLGGVVFGGVALGTFYLRLLSEGVEGHLLLAAPYFVAWLILIVVWLWRGLGYRVRVVVLLLLAYASGVLAFAGDGPAGSGPVWLLIMPALALTLLGSRFGVGASCVAVATYAVFAAAVGLGWVEFVPAAGPTTLQAMVDEGATFALIVVGVTIVLWWSNRGFLAALAETEEARRAAYIEASKSEAILQGIADGVVVIDREGKIVVINDTVARFVGKPAEEIVGSGIGVLLEGVDPQAQAKILGFLASPERLPVRFQWRDRTLSATFSSVSLPFGEQDGIVSVLRDDTEQERLDRARSSFFALAAHELRTPLNSVDGFTDFLRRGLIPPERTKQTLDRILVNTRELRTLVDNLLSLAQDEAGELVFLPGEVALDDLAASVRSTVEVLAQVKGLEIGFRVEDGTPEMVTGDPQWLRTILVNLVSNAVKFTDEGSVSVRFYAPDGDHWAMEVVDTGRGIPEEAYGRIFEPFQIAEAIDTRDRRGAGLGLSIVKGMVDRMGGRIDLESEVGVGSTFAVTLPRAVEAV